MAQCSLPGFEFEPLYHRKVVANFSQNPISSDGGGLLLREADRVTGLCKLLAACFQDFRSASQIEHSVKDLIRQGLFAIALGYKDLISHDALRHDPLHGNQEGRFFNGFYNHYCYLPLYLFCGEFLLAVNLRRSSIDASHGTVEALTTIVKRIR